MNDSEELVTPQIAIRPELHASATAGPTVSWPSKAWHRRRAELRRAARVIGQTAVDNIRLGARATDYQVRTSPWLAMTLVALAIGAIAYLSGRR